MPAGTIPILKEPGNPYLVSGLKIWMAREMGHRPPSLQITNWEAAKRDPQDMRLYSKSNWRYQRK